MNYKKIKEKALKEKDSNKLIELIENYNLQDDEEIMNYFRKIDTKETMEYNFYKRKKQHLFKQQVLLLWKEGGNMSSGVMITGIICLTIIVLALIGSNDRDKGQK